MIKSIRDKDGPFWEVINLETGEKIKDCIWANDETGEYKVHINDDIRYTSQKLEMRKGKIKLIDTRISIGTTLKRSLN